MGVGEVHQGRSGTVYISVTATMPRTERARFMYGADGPVKVWLNGQEADCRVEPGDGESPQEYRTHVEWREGENTLVFAIDTNNGKSAWGVHLSVPDR